MLHQTGSYIHGQILFYLSEFCNDFLTRVLGLLLFFGLKIKIYEVSLLDRDDKSYAILKTPIIQSESP